MDTIFILPSRSEAGDDELLFDYVSYKDGSSPRKSHIKDVLTDLEQTYEKLDINDEELLSRAEHHEVTGSRPLPPPPESCEPNVKRLSITNVKKLEELQVRFLFDYLMKN